jgi:hypothetical protein
VNIPRRAPRPSKDQGDRFPTSCLKLILGFAPVAKRHRLPLIRSLPVLVGFALKIILKPPACHECDFHSDGMVWRSNSALIHQAMTELTSIQDDVEFERERFLIRPARIGAVLATKNYSKGRPASLARSWNISSRACSSLVCLFVRNFSASVRYCSYILICAAGTRPRPTTSSPWCSQNSVTRLAPK